MSITEYSGFGNSRLCLPSIERNKMFEMQVALHSSPTSSSDLTSFKFQVSSFIIFTLFTEQIQLNNIIYNDKRKGFYCQVTSQGGTQCLGKGKGRHYTPMDTKSQIFLENYYKEPNNNLVDLLLQLNKPLPDWLKPSR